VLLMVPVTLIDFDHRIIPNKLMLIGAVLAPALVLWTAPDDIVEHLIAGTAAGSFFLLAVLAYPRGMGVGDIKLAGVLGLFLGRAVGPAIFLALISGTLVGALIMARKGVAAGRKTKVPFGPFLAFGGVVALFAGDAMVDWYLSTFA
jgi:leader peptidase (prepilin peptidase) / N-methyltransferase